MCPFSERTEVVTSYFYNSERLKAERHWRGEGGSLVSPIDRDLWGLLFGLFARVNNIDGASECCLNVVYKMIHGLVATILVSSFPIALERKPDWLSFPFSPQMPFPPFFERVSFKEKKTKKKNPQPSFVGWKTWHQGQTVVAWHTKKSSSTRGPVNFFVRCVSELLRVLRRPI